MEIEGPVKGAYIRTTFRHLWASPVMESASSMPSHALRNTANSSPSGRALAKSPNATFQVSHIIYV